MPFWTTKPTSSNSSPKPNHSGFRSIRAMTMAATSPTDSVWTQKSMRCFSYSHCRRHRIQDLAGFQIKATASLLSHCLSSSSCCAGWLLCASPLDTPPSRRLVILSCRLSFCLVTPAGCRIIISRHPLLALPSSRPLIMLCTTTARGSRATGGTTTATGGMTTDGLQRRTWMSRMWSVQSISLLWLKIMQ